MTLDALFEFLAAHDHGVLATVDAAGQPHAATIGFAVCGRELVFDTLATTRKALNLAHDGRAALAVWHEAQTAQLHGVVDIPEGAERERLVGAYLARFPTGHDRLAWEGLRHFRFRPLWARFSDFGGEVPQITEFADPSSLRGASDT